MTRQEWTEKREQLLKLGQLLDRCFDAEEDHALTLQLEKDCGEPLHVVKRNTIVQFQRLFEGNSPYHFE